MKYVYSVIRFVPDPVRGEFVNVGAVVGSEESSEWGIRIIENLKRARSIDVKGLLPRVLDFAHDIGSKIDRYDEIVQGNLLDTNKEDLSEKWLARMAEESRNVAQFSAPAVIVADSAEEALNTLFDQFIVEPAARRFAFKKKYTALAAMRRAYRDRGLVLETHFEERASVKGKFHKEKFDFVVANGRAVQLTQTWSFQIPDQDALAEDIKAWAWTVEDVRANGGMAEARSARHITVPRDVSINVVYVPPAAGGSTEVLSEALAAFQKINAIPFAYEMAADVGNEAYRLVGSHK